MNANNPIKNTAYHNLSIEDTLKAVNSTHAGLSEDEALQRISVYGKNELQEGKKQTIAGMLLEQFKDVMIIILLIAGVISAFLHEYADAAIILIVVVINAILGVAQQSKAEKALEALKKMSSPFAKVKRNGEVKHIKAEDIVPGDIVVIEAGDLVPADIRLIEAASLKIEEAALTGESVPSEKFTEKIDDIETVLGDRKNMAYSGSSVTYGRGVGVVVGTGMNTEVGKIAGYISGGETEQTPLQKKLAELGKVLSVAVIAICIIIFAVGVFEGRDYFEMFLTAVSLAVAAIPEGLPAIVTIVLALGVQKMAKRNAIIRKLPAVETLGSTEIICSDKTGTLTQNKMTVKQIFFDNRLVDENKVSKDDKNIDVFMQVLTLCNDSKLKRVDDEKIQTIGDPTETALVDFAYAKGFDKNDIEKAMPRVNELPFDSDRKLMTTINNVKGNLRVLTKGAPDILVERCSKVLINGKVEPINEKYVKEIQTANTAMASKALRVLALAYKDVEALPQTITSETVETDLVFAGLVGMIDPPREEVKEAVRVCKQAGIRPVMITGDHRDTATAIAKELNIIQDESEVLTGNDLDKISDEDFVNQVSKYSVYARVSPEHKVRIVKAWKKNNKVVAMTGDGVNDAPALKTADIGVGMGITGTEVSKGVSDMVLADDNFATIVSAVEEGRRIFNNIRKAIQFLLSSNMGEVLTLFVATLLNWEILLPIHILWINLVTDTFPALALGFEKAEKDIMMQKPRESKKSFLSEGLGISIVYQGILEAAIVLSVFAIGKHLYPDDLTVAETLSFATLGLVQLAHSLNVRSITKSIFKVGLFTNIRLLGAILLSGLLQVLVIIVPGLNNIFGVSHLSLNQWLLVIAASISIIPIVELVKFIQWIVRRAKGEA